MAEGRLIIKEGADENELETPAPPRRCFHTLHQNRNTGSKENTEQDQLFRIVLMIYLFRLKLIAHHC